MQFKRGEIPISRVDSSAGYGVPALAGGACESLLKLEISFAVGATESQPAKDGTPYLACE
jgi:hypothetical protein